ncbi:phage tape measure protein [Klebsiella pneumoniae]|nr:phage tape measure protein [Klebsiella pneumoniae]
MAGTFNAGSVVYEVDMDTSRLLAARREVDAALNGLNGSMGRLEASVNRTERSIGSMERTMSSLSGVAKGLLAALSVQQVASYADAWTELNNKVANSVRTGETQAEVMQRIFDVSQATQSSLNGTATLYARLERGTRTYNTSAEDLTRLTTIINQGFAVSGATAQEAENAIIQLSQGIASGVLRGEEFNSVSEQGSRLMVALADSLGVSIGQLRAMAAQGKLTTDVVVKGLLSQGDAIGKEFANTAVSISKGLQVAGNNVTKFFGENSTVKSFAAGFRDSVITISENLETLGTALIGAAAIMGGRFVGALAMATAAQASRAKQTIQGIAATRQQAKEELATSLQLQRRIQLDKQASLATLKRAEETYALARGTAAEGIAYQNLIRLKSIYIGLAAEEIAANNAVAASQARLAATGITLANTMKVVNAVTAPLGGPIGVIAIVAAGWYLYSQRQAEARKEAIAFADTVPDVIKRLKDMNLVQAQGVRADTVSSIKAQEEGIAKLKEEVADLSNRYKDARVAADNSAKGTWLNNDANEKAAELANELAKKLRDLDGATATLKQTKDALHLINIQVNQGIVDQMRAARDNAIAIAIAEAEKQASFLGGTQAFLAEKLGQSTQALKAFNSESLKINWGGKEGEMLIKQAERRLVLSKLEGEAKARQQGAYDAEDAGITDDRGIKRIQDYYAAIHRNVEGRRAAASEAGKLANQQESVAQKLDRLRAAQDLTTESVEKRRIQEAGLRAEQSLGSGATQKQLEEARALGEANERAAISIQKRKEAEQGQKYAKQQIASAQTTVDPSTGRAVDPLAQINLQEQQKLEALAKYQEIDKQNTQLYEDAKTAILQQASYQRQAILQQEQQTYQQNVSSLLGESSNFAGSLADAIGQAAGKSSAAYQALFAISKGFAIAQASLNLQTAISNAMAIPWPANIPAIAQALSAGTQIVSAISGINYSGARYNGGPVSAGGLYQVGEKGKPEIYQASTGKQYMIPGDNGKVISNKDMQGGGLNVQVVINNQASNAEPQYMGATQNDGNYVLEFLISDAERNGPYISTLQSTLGLSRKANGAF